MKLKLHQVTNSEVTAQRAHERAITLSANVGSKAREFELTQVRELIQSCCETDGIDVLGLPEIVVFAISGWCS